MSTIHTALALLIVGCPDLKFASVFSTQADLSFKGDFVFKYSIILTPKNMTRNIY